uniref:Protein kinase domain-containing protein n=1 Tax=Peronospora matthiolae TaxID=2874970 RepID=A0AAV1V6U4_9STRA
MSPHLSLSLSLFALSFPALWTCSTSATWLSSASASKSSTHWASGKRPFCGRSTTRTRTELVPSPWRHALSGARAAPNQTLQLLNRTRHLSAPDGLVASTQQRKQDVDGPDVAGLLAPPVSLLDIRQMAAHLCGALAFLHDQGLIHADVKPENVVQSSPEAPLRPSASTSLPCSSPVKLVDFGNYLGANELAAYADADACGGFDVQTVTYRAPEVAAGLLLCSAMDMWSLGCLLLECVSGKPLFTPPPLETSVQERADVIKVENAHLLKQIERIVTNGVQLDATCAPYQSSAWYNEEAAEECQRVGHDKQAETLQARLQAAAPGNHQLHDFICSLLDVNPATRVTAKQALFHPFLQAFFPFETVFARSDARPASSERETSLPAASASTGAGTQRKAWRSRSRELEEQEASDRVRKRQRSARTVTLARSKDLRQVLKMIPRHRLPLPPR